MALSILRNGVPLDVLFGPKGASKAADTGCKQNGVDVSNLILALVDGQALGFASNISQNGSDFNTKFGKPTGNTPLPIDGGSYSASAFSGTVSSSASLVFNTSSTAWSLTRTVSPNSGSGTIASGSIPSGATSVQMTLNIILNTGGTTSSSNSAPTQTSLATNQIASVSATSTPSTVEKEIKATLQINYYNASNVIISTTNITIDANATGSS